MGLATRHSIQWSLQVVEAKYFVSNTTRHSIIIYTHLCSGFRDLITRKQNRFCFLYYLSSLQWPLEDDIWVLTSALWSAESAYSPPGVLQSLITTRQYDTYHERITTTGYSNAMNDMSSSNIVVVSRIPLQPSLIHVLHPAAVAVIILPPIPSASWHLHIILE